MVLTTLQFAGAGIRVESTIAVIFRVFPTPRTLTASLLLVLLSGLLVSPNAPAADSEFPRKIESIPSEFDPIADQEGYAWVLNKDASVKSGRISYFRAAMALKLEGEAPPVTAVAQLSGNEYRFTLGKESGPQFTRDVWVDPERSAARFLDVLENPGEEAVNLRVEYTTTYQAQWQDLHLESGQIYSQPSGGILGARQYGLVARFGQLDGRHDTLFLLTGEKEELKPAVRFSSNQRELVFEYSLEIPAGKKVALLHWVIQRNLAGPEDAEDEFEAFYQRRQLVSPNVSNEVALLVRNFNVEPRPAGAAQPFDKAALVAVNRLSDSLGIERGRDDVLWITEENQLAGKVAEGATLTAEGRWGTATVGAARIAAIQGGNGIGRQERIFLRDGRVLAGELSAENLKMTGPDGWEMDLAPADLGFVISALDAADGKLPENSGSCVALRSGEVLISDAADAAASITVLSPWGAKTVPLGEIVAMDYASAMAPKFRLNLADGSRLSVLLLDAELTVKRVPEGDTVTFPARDIVSVWKAGDPLGEPALDESDLWLALEDLGEPGDLVYPAALLKGNNLLRADLATESLHLVAGSSVTEVKPAEMLSIRRSDESEFDAVPLFEVEMASGDTLTGRLRERTLTLATGDDRWDVPVQHFLEWVRNEE